jgi:hypothetical protein
MEAFLTTDSVIFMDNLGISDVNFLLELSLNVLQSFTNLEGFGAQEQLFSCFIGAKP